MGDVRDGVHVGSVDGELFDWGLPTEPDAVAITTQRRVVVASVKRFPNGVTADVAGAAEHES